MHLHLIRISIAISPNETFCQIQESDNFHQEWKLLQNYQQTVSMFQFYIELDQNEHTVFVNTYNILKLIHPNTTYISL